MVNWREFERREPEFAAAVAARFAAHKHKTMATVRADGGPRICGTEAELVDGDLWLGGMTGNRRFADLRRDPRIEIHSGSDEPDVWSGDARVGGEAIEVTDPVEHERFRGGTGEVPPGPFELFRIDLRTAVLIRLDAEREHLLIDSWQVDRGLAPTVQR
ncbi:MAG TPA: pyridoxamine 5'-phosphate oxidase family protein [Kineosporiaceae bacterium]|nr:pyridoxamine 5'-phosphate oxidase family protein [Kineosporiaceae bacterium]